MGEEEGTNTTATIENIYIYCLYICIHLERVDEFHIVTLWINKKTKNRQNETVSCTERNSVRKLKVDRTECKEESASHFI